MRPLQIQFQRGQKFFYKTGPQGPKTLNNPENMFFNFPQKCDFPRSRPSAGQHQQNDKQYVNKVNVNKVNVQVNVNKVDVKINVNKFNDKLNDIYSIRSHYKGGSR